MDQKDFDANVRPGDDFFRYVNGGWLDRNPIPPDEARWGSFYTLRFDVESQLKKILDGLTARNDFLPGSSEQKVRDFYREATDVEKRNRLGVAPLAEIFKKIDDVANLNDLSRVVGELHRVPWSSLLGYVCRTG